MHSVGNYAALLASAAVVLCVAACDGSPSQNSAAVSAPSSSQAPSYWAVTDAERSRTLGEIGRSVEARFADIKDPVARAEAEMKAGYAPVALEVLDMLTPLERADERYAGLHQKLTTMINTDSNADQIAGIAFKIKTYWQPQLDQEPTAEPATVADLWKREQFFEAMAGNLDDDRITDDQGRSQPMPPAAKAAWDRFRAELSARQAQIFPKLRHAYVKLAASGMWLQDVYVDQNGRKITFSGALFAANQNVMQAHLAAMDDLRKLRFAEDAYDWCRACGGTKFELKSPADSTVARWNGQSFELVK